MKVFFLRRLAFVALLACASQVALAQTPPDWFPCDASNEQIQQSNPLGNNTCMCGDNLWVDADCLRGYLCYDTTGFGCLIVRLKKIILLHFAFQYSFTY